MGLMSWLTRSKAVSSSRELDNLLRSHFGGTTTSGASITSNNALRIAAVYSCVQVLLQSVAQLPLHQYKRSGDERVKDREHPLYSVVHDQPNEWMTSFDMLSFIMVCLLLRGNSVWLKTKFPGTETIRELIPIQPHLIESIQQDEAYNLWYKIRRPGKSQLDTIPKARLLHFKGMSLDGFSGLSPIAYQRECIGLSKVLGEHGSRLFRNGAQLGGILTHPGKLTEKAARNIKDSFEEKYSSVENAHKTALFEEGLKWQSVAMTSEDSQFLDSRKYQRTEIAGIFRVPPHMIGDLTNATLTNVENLDLGFVKHSLTPWLVNIEQTLKKDLLNPVEKKSRYYKFNVDGLLRGDMKNRNDAYARAILTGWMSRNEVRELSELNPVDGLDEFLYPMNEGLINDDSNNTRNKV